MKRYVLLGDLHAFDLWPAPWRLLGKRLLGQVNLWSGRHKQFDLSLLPAILEHARSLKPDGAFLTGDLTTTSLESEFRFMHQALAALTGEIPSLAVAGNHDRYTRAAARERRMERFMPGLLPERYPLFRPLTDRWHLLALESGRPRGFSSTGLIGRQQLQQAQGHLSKLTASDGLVVLCHYPADIPSHIPEHRGHMLEDRQSLLDLLARSAARTVFLHGHLHQPWVHQPSPENLKHVTLVNIGSPTRVSRELPLGQGFWSMDLPDSPGQSIELAHHQPSLDGLAHGDGRRNISAWNPPKVHLLA